MIYAIIAAMLLTGCAMQPRVYTYSWGQVIVADANAVARECTPEAGHYDNGAYRPRHARVNGCYKPWSKEIWLDYRADKYTLIHELAHRDGYSDPERQGFARMR